MDVISIKLVENKIMLEHSKNNGNIKQETEAEGSEIGLQEYNLSHSCSDNLKEVTKGSLSNVECAGKCSLQPKIESDVAIGHRECNVKRETEAVKFSFEPIEKQVESCMSKHISIKQELDAKKLEVDQQSHYLSGSHLNVQKGIDSSPYKVGSAGGYSVQVKNEEGLEKDNGECSFKSEAVKCNEIHSYNSMQYGIQNNTRGEVEVCDGQFHKSLMNEGEKCSEINFQDHSIKVNFETEEKSFQCHLCEYKSKHKYDLKRHIDYKHNNKRGKESPEIYHCQFCKCKYRDKNYLKKHVEYKHNENAKWYQCSFCRYKSKRKDGLTSHLEQHNANREIYRCQFCEHETKYERGLKKHINNQHYNEIGKESPEVYQCQFCEYRTKYKYVLKNHINCKHNEKPKWYECSSCDYKTKYRSSLVKHIDCKHTPEIYKCEFCECKYKCKTYLKKHIDYKHNEDAKWYECSFCGYKTKLRQCLSVHLEQHNTNRKIYLCQFCELKCSLKSTLIKHINQKHFNEIGKESPEEYQCQFCEYRTKYKHVLKVHIKYKHSENPRWHQCSFCDYVTKYRSSLVKHISCKHAENPKWYQCSSCDYRSKYRCSVGRHINYKHNERTRMC